MTTKHTPGTWFTDGVPRQPHGAIGVFTSDGVACIALVQPGCLPADWREDAAQANARLIAAAPDLLRTLEAAVVRIENANREGDPILSAWLPGAEAVIAAAGQPAE